jgi:hypothetical protein
MSLDLTRYTGIGQFGRAYMIMLSNDAHAPGSVDRVLAEGMIQICASTAPHLYTDYTPTDVPYRTGSRPTLEECLCSIVLARSSSEAIVRSIGEFCSHLTEKVAGQKLDDALFGGTEEEIIEKGSDWCTDVARVGCVLCQVWGIPARLVMLFDTSRAYSGHVIVEAYRSHVWGALDPLTNVIYRDRDGTPCTVWKLMNRPQLVKAHWRGPATLHTMPDQFRAAAISNYFVWERDRYDYTVTHVNAYYRSILEESDRGWPEGLRWLHGEDSSESETHIGK